jgi:hypothetical protein
MPELNQSIAAIPLPDRMRSLPISSRGFPVPWFVTVRDAEGEWDFRVVDPRRVAEAVNRKRCWICGKPLGRHIAFAIGPMCSINRITSEPPAHRVCAEYAVKACPFMSHPRARRNDIGMPAEKFVPGLMIARNPGVIAIWITETFRPFRTERGGPGVLFSIGEPSTVTWWCEGRPATRDEVEDSVDAGFPALEAAAALDGEDGKAALSRQLIESAPIIALAGSTITDPSRAGDEWDRKHGLRR